MSISINDLKVQIYADGADKQQILALAENPLVKGFTTNPSLMRKAGIADYEAFARDLLAAVPNHPISFEVFADDISEMEDQARQIATWGKNVYVKIPVSKSQITMQTVKELQLSTLYVAQTIQVTIADFTNVDV